MKMDRKAQNLIEWIASKTNLYPFPMADAQCMLVLSKAILVAFKLDIFETAKDSSQTIEQIALKTKLHPKGLKSLMNILTSIGYFKYKDGKFGLTKVSKKWCLKDSRDSVYNHNRYIESCWDDLMDHLEEYLKTGKGLGIHETYTEEQWNWYQLSMENLARFTARLASKMAPMPNNPAEMLDIGGSHGLYCVELCKKYPTLKATILELPQAVKKAKPILAKFNMGDRINYWTGNALIDDFGENRYDFILMSSLMHHFSAEQNIELSKKVAKALKPGAYFVIQEYLRSETSSSMEQVGIITDMTFNLTSTSGTWSLNELKDFQEKAGLIHYKVNKFMGLLFFVQVCAKKG
jgi:ubiquinone/menaquinone biosynthesis C-methylase UbiE